MRVGATRNISLQSCVSALVTCCDLDSLMHLEIGDNPMHVEWQNAIVKGLPYLFHHCRQIANERKHRGKPPEMEYVTLVGQRMPLPWLTLRPSHWQSRHKDALRCSVITSALWLGAGCRYVGLGIGDEATLTKAEFDNWFRELLRLAQQTYVLKLQFKSLLALPDDILNLQNIRELNIVGNTLVRPRAQAAHVARVLHCPVWLYCCVCVCTVPGCA